MKRFGQTAAMAALAATLGLASATASAVSLFGSDVYIDLGTNAYDNNGGVIYGNGDANTTTGIFTEFGFSQFLATSVYNLSDGSLLGDFYDTNDSATLTALGIPVVGATALDGVTSVNIDTPADPAQIDLDALSPLVPPLNSDSEGFLATWELVAVYTLNGTLTATSPDYTSGTIDIIFREKVDLAGAAGLDEELVLSLSLTSSSIVGPNLDLFFDVTFAKDNFFWIDSGGVFVDAADQAPGSVTMALDTNVNPPIPTQDQLVLLADGNNGGRPVAVRQTTLDGSIGAKVPEPGTLVLLGIGLLALSSRRLKQKA